MTAARRGRNKSTDTDAGLALAMVALLAAALALAWTSREFVYGAGHAQRPIPLVVGLLISAGLVWAWAIARLRHDEGGPLRLTVVIGFSLLLSGVQFGTNPIQESDFYRYLLDGGVTACGENPYVLSPQEQRSALKTVVSLQSHRPDHASAHDSAPPACLTDDPRWLTVVDRVNYPELRTIYPPLMQLWFATAVKIGGPRIESLRASFLLAEALLLIVLAGLLAELGMSTTLVAVVGWSPLFFKEIANSAHYDVVPAALLVAAGWMLVRHSHLAAALLLGLCAGTKLFAVALLPLWLRAVPSERRVPAILLFATAMIAPWFAFSGAGADMFEGTRAFAERWVINDPLFSPAMRVFAAVGFDGAPARAALAGMLAAVVLLVTAVYPVHSFKPRSLGVLRGSLVILALVLVAGPTANPWYFVWLLPLVAVDPRPLWFALIVMMPLYYGHFYLDYNGMSEHARALTTVEFLPFFLFAIAALFQRNMSSSR